MGLLQPPRRILAGHATISQVFPDMPPAPLLASELERVAALRSYAILDTACEARFDEIARLAARLLDMPIAAISLVDASRQWFKARIGLPQAETPRDEAFCAYTILDAAPLVVPDATADRRFADNPMVTGEPGIRFYAGVPLTTPDGYRLGSLCVIDRRARALSAEQIETLAILGRTVMTTLELHRAMIQVRDLALTDPLTGLRNRAALLDALQDAVAGRAAFGLLYIDLDGFKQINDSHGHAAGDRLLQQVAALLRRVVMPPDLVARVGGDEFIVLTRHAWDQAPSDLAEHLRHALAVAMRRNGWPITASVGAVQFETAPRDVAEALSVADQLMYGAKLAGRDRVLSRVFGQAEAA